MAGMWTVNPVVKIPLALHTSRIVTNQTVSGSNDSFSIFVELVNGRS
jgi:hypothetical protein